MYSSEPAKSAPASRASFALSGFAMTRTRFVLPVPDGMTTEPRTIWSAYFGLTPRRTERRPSRPTSTRSWSSRGSRRPLSLCTSSAARNLRVPSCTSCQPSVFSCLVKRSPRNELPGIGEKSVRSVCGPDDKKSVDDFEAHRARGTCHRAHRGLDARGVEVGELLLRDLADLLARHLADLVLFGSPDPARSSRPS